MALTFTLLPQLTESLYNIIIIQCSHLSTIVMLTVQCAMKARRGFCRNVVHVHNCSSSYTESAVGLYRFFFPVFFTDSVMTNVLRTNYLSLRKCTSVT